MSFEPGRGRDAAVKTAAAPRDLKGKGKEKAGTAYSTANANAPEDDLAWYTTQAIESLKGMRSKPASAL